MYPPSHSPPIYLSFSFPSRNPYPASNSIQTRRASARRIGSTYAYDFLGLIEVSLIQKWDRWLKDLAAAFPARMGDKMPEKVRHADQVSS